MKTIKIGPITYSVEEIERLTDYNADGKLAQLNGNIRYWQSRVLIEATLTTQMKAAVLWHEAIHGLTEQSGHDHEVPECVILALGYGIVQLIKDNPDLVALTVGERSAET